MAALKEEASATLCTVVISILTDRLSIKLLTVRTILWLNSDSFCFRNGKQSFSKRIIY